MLPFVIIGAGGHARVVIELARATNAFSVCGLIDPRPSAQTVLGVPVIGGDEKLRVLQREGIGHAFVAIGDNRIRQKVAMQLALHGFIQPALTHPSAVLSPSARVEPGSLVMARAVLGTEAVLAAGAILNTGAVADHDCILSAYCHVAPGSALAGAVTVGERTLVGVGSSVKPGVRIGSDTVIGAGAAVVDDVANGVTAVGVPARIIKRA